MIKRALIGGSFSYPALALLFVHRNGYTPRCIPTFDFRSKDLISPRIDGNFRCMTSTVGHDGSCMAHESISKKWNFEYLEVQDKQDDSHRIAYHFYRPLSEEIGRNKSHSRFSKAHDAAIPLRKKCNPDTIVIFLTGLLSSMEGTKSNALHQYCQEKGHSYLCFDYRGHGESDGQFEQCDMHDWMEDSRLMLNFANSRCHDSEGESDANISNEEIQSNIILVGSSMGAWIALNLALEFPHLISVVVGIGSAIDFTHFIYQNNFTDEQRALWKEEPTNTRKSEEDTVMVSSPYLEGPFPLTRQLYESGKCYLLAPDRKNNKVKCAVRLLHGVNDEIVPLSKVMDDVSLLRIKYDCNDIRITTIPNGDHRLSRIEDIALLIQTLDDVISVL